MVAGIAVVTVVAAAVVWAVRGQDADPTRAADLGQVSGVGAQRTPPWPAPADVPGRTAVAGLAIGAMGTAAHYHVHLDVLVNGQPVAVPTSIGVDPASGMMSGLHTHTPDGVLHIEAARGGQPFTLGQLFTQWDVALNAGQVGVLRATGGNTLGLHVNGRKVPGNPAMLRLAPHQQITLVYGPAGQKVQVPDTYTFAPGE